MERTPRLDDYTLETELGRGATGVVYRATSRDGRLVAIKLFDQALARDEVDVPVWNSLRNLQHVHALTAGELNAYDVLVSDWVVFTQGSLPASKGSQDQ